MTHNLVLSLSNNPEYLAWSCSHFFSLYKCMGGTETFTRDFYDSFIHGSLMIWFPAGRSYSSIVLFFLFDCCYYFLSLSLSRHNHQFNFVVDLRQIEFDRIIETITTTIIITTNWTFSLSRTFFIFFCIRQTRRVLHMDIYVLCALVSTPSGLAIIVQVIHFIYSWHSTRLKRWNNLSL